MTGDELREIRVSLGWSQVRLAGYVGVSPSAIYRWEACGPGSLPQSFLERMGMVALFDGLTSHPALATWKRLLKAHRS